MPDPWRAAVVLLAAALLAVPLLLAQAAAQDATALPLELPLLLLLLAAAPAAAMAPLRVVAAAVLSALLAIALLDLATTTALGRRFNPILDGALVPAGWRLAVGSLGLPLAAGAAAALATGLGLAVGALWWATGHAGRFGRSAPARLSRPGPEPGQRPPAPPGRPLRDPPKGVPLPFPRAGAASRLGRPMLLALALPVALLAAVDAAPGSTAAARLGWEHVRDGWRAGGELAGFRVEAAGDRWAAAPAEAILPALTGRDVFLVFVESYGRSAHENPLYAPTVAATLGAAETRLVAAGLAARSAWLTSPVVGGQSWLAHATLLSGLAIGDEARYRALLASPRKSLLHLAAAAGWRTAAVMPAITLPWPEAAWFGYDTVLAAKDLGYRGTPFNWVTMPDQFTLAALERRLLGPGPRPPVFAEVALISSHAPWTPVPPLLPWEAIDDGTVFDAWATSGDPPEVVWRDPDRVRAQYLLALDYALGTAMAFAERRAAGGPVLVVLGDHQPAAFVSGDPEGRDVPVHVIGPPEVVARLGIGWSPGLLPAAGALVLPMQGFRDHLLDSFGGNPPGRQAALAEPLPELPGN